MSLKITYFVHGTTTDNENGLASGLVVKGRQNSLHLYC